jgi:hypothetical protein
MPAKLPDPALSPSKTNSFLAVFYAKLMKKYSQYSTEMVFY